MSLLQNSERDLESLIQWAMNNLIAEKLQRLKVGHADLINQREGREDPSSGSVRRRSVDPDLLVVTAWEDQSRG